MTRYKQSNINGIRVGEHVRVMCKELGIKSLPKTLLVHHLDGDKHNNNINNLAVMNYFAHNKIHSHKPWNKGLTTKDKKWFAVIQKIHKTRNENFKPLFEETYKMFKSGMTVIEIAKHYNKNRETIYNRLRKYGAFKPRRITKKES